MVKIFLDVDNTIIEHSGFYSLNTESRIHRSIGRFPKEHETAIKRMYESSVCSDPKAVKDLFYSNNVYILTKYPHIEFELHKQARVADILGITIEELQNMKDENGISKYIALDINANKSDTIKELFGIDSIKNFILVDDYSQNIIEWEQAGGIGFKYYNEYNSPRHPMNGISVSNFKMLHSIVNESKRNKLFVVATNKYKLKLLEQQLMKLDKEIQIIPIIKYIINDLKEKIGIEDLQENHKYSYVDFLVDYYEFVNRANDSYWTDVIRPDVEENKNTVFSSVFEPNFSSIYKNTNLSNDEILTINLISSKATTKHIYDIYLTIDERLVITDIDEIFKFISDIINLFIFDKK